MIQSFGQYLAMDGLTQYISHPTRRASAQVQLTISNPSDVVDSLTETYTKAKSNIREITHATGNKVKFNVNEELGQVVVKIVDSSTDKVVREIPSADMQEVRVTIKQTMGVFFDERV